jgi:uncharacterized membrane protein (UPF0127 family)
MVMARKMVVLLPAILAAFIIGILGLLLIPSEVKNRDLSFPTGAIKIDNDTIKVEVANSSEERQRWLKFREDPIPLDRGMLLIYGKPDLYALWLINIQYNLDLIWFDENGQVVYIKENALFCTNPFDASKCTYKNTSAAKYVVAASSGFVANHNISLSSAMEIVSI